jgi:hypothetical protein
MPKYFVSVAFVALWLTGQAVEAVPRVLPPATRYNARVAIAWFDLLYDLIRLERLSPPVASRAIGIAGVTLYEAVHPGMPGYRSLSGQLNNLPDFPHLHGEKNFHWPTVANSALAEALRRVFTSQSALAAIDDLESNLADETGSDLHQRVRWRSNARGRIIATLVTRWSRDDGFLGLDHCPFRLPVGPRLWVPTPPGFERPLQPCWGDLRPMVLRSSETCAPPAPAEYSEDPASDFFAEAFEVYTTVKSLTDEQRTIALFWADNPGLTGTPAGHWISIVGQVVAANDLSLAVAAEAYAKVGLAVTDAFISCWRTKYTHNLLRPITYVHDVINDTNWTTFVSTPPFPEYTSGHSVQSAAVATVLTDIFGERPFIDGTHVELGLPPRSFKSFFEAADEAAISRLYCWIRHAAHPRRRHPPLRAHFWG